MNYCIYGNEQPLVKNKIREIMHHYDNQEEVAIAYYDGNSTGFRIQEVIDDCMTIPFLSKHKVVIVQNALFLTANSNLSDKDQNTLIEYLENSSKDIDLILTGNFDKFDSRKKMVKSIQKLMQCHVFNHLQEDQFIAYVKQTLKANQLNLTNDALEELLSRLNSDMLTFKHIVDKLCLYPEALDIKAIQSLVSRPLEDNVFALVDAVIKSNIKDAFFCWRDLQVINSEPIALVALIGGQFKLLYQVKILTKNNYTKEDIASKLKIHPYRVKLAIESSRRISESRLSALIMRSAQFDQQLKMGLVNKTLGFEHFLLDVTRG